VRNDIAEEERIVTLPNRARRTALPAILGALTLLAGLLPAAAVAPVLAVSPNIVISQVYGGGGNAGATYTHDFVELFNRGTTPVNVAGWSVQYGSATGTGLFSPTPISGTVNPGQYYLVQMAAGAGGTTPLPTPDATGSTAMSGTAGKVIVANVAGGIGCNGGSTACTPTQLGQIVDLVGYGTANFFEGAAAAPGLSNTTSASRAGDGCADSDQNGVDFTAGAVNPRNSASPLNPCAGDAAPFVSSSTPADGAFHDANANLSVTFSEPVNVAGAWFSISCSVTGAHSAVAAGGPTTFSLDPDVDFMAGESCTLTIHAAGVADQDAEDPPDLMAADASIGFTVSTQCGDDATLIHEIQGSGATTPIPGATVEIEGIVVGDYQLSSSFNGFYVQEEDTHADADPLTSEGIFVFEGGSAVEVALGDTVRVAGTVVEFSSSGISLTELTSVSRVLVCSSGDPLPAATPVTMPFPTLDHPERWEGMRVTFSQALTVTEVFTLARFGEAVLSSGDRLYNPTELALPGAPAIALQEANNRNRIVLDDGDNLQNIDPTLYPQGGLSAANTLRVGDTLPGGNVHVLDHRFGGYRLQPTEALSFSHNNARTAAPDPVGGDLKVASFNVLNYFNGDGLGGGFPTSRGAESQFEFDRQRDKIISALVAIDADIVGLMEIENDGSGPTSAIADLVNGLNAATAPGTYAYISTGVVGTDEIAVALIYQPAAATPAGPHAILDSSVDPRFIDTSSRPVIAQTFDTLAGGRLTVAVNHLKSKGSACDFLGDPDIGDGQGNCNLTRLAAAQAEIDWLASDPTGSGDHDLLVIGDLNSYALEDPIRAFVDAGYTDVLKLFGGPLAYSYVFQGQSGTLDHALASPSLLAQATGATSWHINPDEPIGLDYNVNFKSAGQVISFYAPDPYRSSDHDPAVVGLAALGYDFSGFFAPVGAAPASIAATAGSTIPVKFSLAGNQGLGIFFATPTVQQRDCATSAPIGSPSDAVTAGGSSLSYDASIDQYVFAWKTARDWAGTCRTFELTLDDGSYHTIDVAFG
jgi:hypothetical protein